MKIHPGWRVGVKRIKWKWRKTSNCVAAENMAEEIRSSLWYLFDYLVIVVPANRAFQSFIIIRRDDDVDCDEYDCSKLYAYMYYDGDCTSNKSRLVGRHLLHTWFEELLIHLTTIFALNIAQNTSHCKLVVEKIYSFFWHFLKILILTHFRYRTLSFTSLVIVQSGL